MLVVTSVAISFPLLARRRPEQAGHGESRPHWEAIVGGNVSGVIMLTSRRQAAFSLSTCGLTTRHTELHSSAKKKKKVIYSEPVFSRGIVFFCDSAGSQTQ